MVSPPAEDEHSNDAPHVSTPATLFAGLTMVRELEVLAILQLLESVCPTGAKAGHRSQLQTNSTRPTSETILLCCLLLLPALACF